jgi:FAD synthase
MSESELADREMIEKVLPIRMISKVVRGFGRGSSDLGIPTANLDRNCLQTTGERNIENLPCGIYWGFCRLGEKTSHVDESDPTGVVYKAAISIGYNPTYGNEQKTVEPHLIATKNDPRRHASSCGETVFQEFYEQSARLSLVGYLRPELPFEGLDKLIAAIKKDIENADIFADSCEKIVLKEKSWVESEVVCAEDP